MQKSVGQLIFQLKHLTQNSNEIKGNTKSVRNKSQQKTTNSSISRFDRRHSLCLNNARPGLQTVCCNCG